MLTTQEQQQYTQRNAILLQLGFSSYKNYLNSAIWQDIRYKVLLPSSRCRACGKKATQVHHNRYLLEDMNGACLAQLIPVCGKCHHACEFNRIGLKIGPERATEKLDMMRQNNQRIWQKEDARNAWQFFFAVLDEVRIYLGMDESEQARSLIERFDLARMALPSRRHKKGK